MKDKVILAYSGGLDTTAIIPWLKENYDYDVVCVCIDVGQGNELDGLEERAKLSGAEKLYIENVTDEFVDEYVVPCVHANADYRPYVDSNALDLVYQTPLWYRTVHLYLRGRDQPSCQGAGSLGS